MVYTGSMSLQILRSQQFIVPISGFLFGCEYLLNRSIQSNLQPRKFYMTFQFFLTPIETRVIPHYLFCLLCCVFLLHGPLVVPTLF